MTTLTTMHPLWGEFERRLTRALAMEESAAAAVALAEAAAIEKGKRALTQQERDLAELVILAHGCNGKRDPIRAHEATRAILALIADVDVPRTLAFLRLHAGYCDCEVLLNVADKDCAGPPDGCDSCRYFKDTPRGRELARMLPQIEREYLAALRSDPA